MVDKDGVVAGGDQPLICNVNSIDVKASDPRRMDYAQRHTLRSRADAARLEWYSSRSLMEQLVVLKNGQLLLIIVKIL